MVTIAIIGSGVVGTATGKAFAARGHDVIFSDVDAPALQSLDREGYRTCDAAKLESLDVDVSFLCPPTPTVDGRISLDSVLSAARSVGEGSLRHNGNYSLVVVRSTVVPGTTEEHIIPLLERQSGKEWKRDFGVCMHPSFLRERQSLHDELHPWVVVAGAGDERSHEVLCTLYGSLACPYVRLTLKEAEMEKYVHNLFDACKIAYFNEMRLMCERAGVDAGHVFEVAKRSAQASFDPEYGIQNFGAFGGNCFPKDMCAFLAWAATQYGESLPLLSGITISNQQFQKDHPPQSPPP